MYSVDFGENTFSPFDFHNNIKILNQEILFRNFNVIIFFFFFATVSSAKRFYSVLK